MVLERRSGPCGTAENIVNYVSPNKTHRNPNPPRKARERLGGHALAWLLISTCVQVVFVPPDSGLTQLPRLNLEMDSRSRLNHHRQWPQSWRAEHVLFNTSSAARHLVISSVLPMSLTL